ncbi:MAG: sigma-70 family RNA polymerase sigma factor [Saprospiraceae bacterium]|nr:sigma-70 family RNA polymerase sigma factor [Saprospiraceae bacterium]
MKTSQEEQLVKSCLRGDSTAQRALYEHFKVPMFRLCLRYAKDRPEAEDLLQDGFIRVFLDLHQYKFNGALGGWIRRVIVNVALQHIRKNKKMSNVVELETVVNDYQTDEDVFSNMGVKALTKIIQKLPPGYRAVFNMYVIEGYSHKEIAEKMNFTVGSSKSQLSKAKAMLREMLEKIMMT